MKRGERAHRQPDHVRALDAERIEHAARVVARSRLGVALDLRRHVGRRIAARVVRDAAVAARKMPQLRLPASAIAGELVHEEDRGSRAGLLEKQPDAVVRGDCWHNAKPIWT